MADLTEEQTRHRAMIERAAQQQGLTIVSWESDEEEHRDKALFGRYAWIDETEEHYAGDEGELAASVVGAQKYHNERVSFMFTADGMEIGDDVDPHLLEYAGE